MPDQNLRHRAFIGCGYLAPRFSRAISRRPVESGVGIGGDRTTNVDRWKLCFVYVCMGG